MGEAERVYGTTTIELAEKAATETDGITLKINESGRLKIEATATYEDKEALGLFDATVQRLYFEHYE